MKEHPWECALTERVCRHGLRASELCALKWSQIDLRHGRLHVNRAKGGQESVHPLHGPELRALRPLQGQSPYVFVTEAGTPVTTAWFLRMIQRTCDIQPDIRLNGKTVSRQPQR